MPDLYTLTVGVGEGAFGIGGISMDRNFNFYGFLGGGVGVAAPLPASASLTGGYLNTSTKPSPDELKNAITGRATEVSGGFVGGGGVVMGSNKPKIYNGGLYTPGVNAAVTGTKFLGNPVKFLDSAINSVVNQIQRGTGPIPVPAVYYDPSGNRLERCY